MATADPAICKNIERELKALIMPSENQLPDKDTKPTYGPAYSSFRASSKPDGPSEFDGKNYENDFPVLGTEKQPPKVWTHPRKEQNHSGNGNDGRGGKRDSRRGKQSNYRDDRGSRGWRPQPNLVKSVVPPYGKTQTAGQSIANKVVIDLRDHPVAPPKNVEMIDTQIQTKSETPKGDSNTTLERDDRRSRGRRAQPNLVNGMVPSLGKDQTAGQIIANKVVIDLRDHQVAPPKNFEMIETQFQPKSDVSKRNSNTPFERDRKFVDVNLASKNLAPEEGTDDDPRSRKKRQKKKKPKFTENKQKFASDSKETAEAGASVDVEKNSKQTQKSDTTSKRKPAFLVKKNERSRDGEDVTDRVSNCTQSISSRMRDEAYKREEARIEEARHRLWDKAPSISKKRSLEEEFIFTLRKPSQRFPGAQFFCHLCKYHCNLENVDRHVAAKNHRAAIEVRRTETLLKCLPYPSPLQTQAITELIESIAKEVGLSEEDLKAREDIIERLNQVINSHIPGCRVKMYGSSVSGLGLKGSDVNIDVLLPSGASPPTILSKLHQVLKQQDEFSDVKSEFDAKLPRISFVDLKTGLFCDVSWNNVQAYNTSKLLADYASLDPRVKVLGKAFRYWAKLCTIDYQERGTLPSHVFSLLLVYFLQQHKPAVLPVLHELIPGNDIEKYLNPSEIDKKWKSFNQETVGELWIDLFRFYSVGFKSSEYVVCLRRRKPVLRGEKSWTGKVMAIEDPYCRKRNLTRSISSQIVYHYIRERFNDSYKYFGIPQLTSGALFTNLRKELLQADGRYRVGEENRPPIKEYEDESVGESEVKDKELKLNETCEGDLSEDDDEDIIEELNGNSELEPRKVPTFTGNDSSSDFEDQDPDLSAEEVITRISKMGLSALRRKSDRTESESSEVFELLNDSTDLDKTREEDKDIPVYVSSVLVGEIRKLMSSFTQEDLVYVFDKMIFTGGKLPPIYCSLCFKEGHLKQSCPDEILPDLKPLPPMTPEFMSQLNSICEQVMRENMPSPSEFEDRRLLLKKLQDVIRETYPDARLDLYGSSCNGFGFTGSDLDVCVTLESKKSCEGLEFSEMISTLATNMQKHQDFSSILPITTAKVPIVKVTDKNTNIECDISFYNTLAQHNTRMLHLYSEIDQRVQMLGYTVKYFAKLCEIGDASRGSLSSYAFILMVLHFLQQREPPVLPVLQELYDHTEKSPETIVEGWNAWFYDDLEKLPTVWPEMGKNTESVGELWLGLLRYYTEDFNLKENVICIRKKETLTRFEKMWNSKSIAIEDPFDLNHNLGAGVSCKMNTFIMKALINGRHVFGSPFDIFYLPKRYRTYRDYLFCPDNLKDGAPPNDRGCRICCKIGHKFKDCPARRQGKKRDQRQDGRQRQRGGKWQHENRGMMQDLSTTSNDEEFLQNVLSELQKANDFSSPQLRLPGGHPQGNRMGSRPFSHPVSRPSNKVPYSERRFHPVPPGMNQSANRQVPVNQKRFLNNPPGALPMHRNISIPPGFGNNFRPREIPPASTQDALLPNPLASSPPCFGSQLPTHIDLSLQQAHINRMLSNNLPLQQHNVRAQQGQAFCPQSFKLQQEQLAQQGAPCRPPVPPAFTQVPRRQ